MTAWPEHAELFSRQNPSPEYQAMLAWSTEYHATHKTFDGTRLYHSYPTIHALCKEYNAKTLFDFGCGKGQHYQDRDIVIGERVVPSLAEDLGCAITGYDPAWPPLATLPAGQTFDGVVTTDVLQYIPMEDLPWVARELFGFAAKFVFAGVSVLPGKKPWGDGRGRSSWRPRGLWLSIFTDLGKEFPHVDWVVRCKEPDKSCHVWRKDDSVYGYRHAAAYNLGAFGRPAVPPPPRPTPPPAPAPPYGLKELPPEAPEPPADLPAGPPPE
jgi:hypothetical protein